MEEGKKTNGLKEVTKEILGWEDNKLFRTLNHLTTRPGQVVSEYCRGEKQKYLSPVVYFFGVTALETYIASRIGLYDFVLKQNVESLRQSFSDPIFAKSGFNVSSTPDQMNSVFSFLFSETGQKVIILPIVLLFTWIFYKKYNRNFKENSWFALYTAGHASLLTTPLILYWYITKDLVLSSAIGFIVELTYGVWASKQFYNLSLGKAIFLRIMMAVAVLVIFMIFGGLLGVLIEVLY